MVKFYIGKVESIDETFHTITFSMQDFTNSSAIPMTAIPLVPATTVPEQDDEVFIIQPESRVEIFYYTQMPNPSEDSQFVELKYLNSIVKIVKDSKEGMQILIDSDNRSSISLTKDKVEMKAADKATLVMDSTSVLINGHLKVTR